MKWFGNLKIARKLAIGFGACLVLTGVLGWTAVSKMSRMNEEARLLVDDTIEGLSAVVKVAEDTKQVRISQVRQTLTADPAARSQIENEIRSSADSLSKAIEEYDKTISIAEDRNNFKAFKEKWAGYMAFADKSLALGRRHDVRAASQLHNGPMRAAFLDAMQALDKVTEWQKSHGTDLEKESRVAFTGGRSIVMTVLGFAILFGILSGWFISRMITSAVKQVAERMEFLRAACLTDLGQAMEAMAGGDLTTRITPRTPLLEIDTKDELGQMAQTFNGMRNQTVASVEAYNRMQESLSKLVGEVTNSASTVAASSEQLTASSTEVGQAANSISQTMQEVSQAAEQSARGSQEVAAGTEQQARTATEAAQNMEMLERAIGRVREGSHKQKTAVIEADGGMKQAAKSVEQVAKASEQIAGATQQAAAVAQSGGKAVEKTVASMGRIRQQVEVSAETVKELGEKGAQIGAIVETIDQIAEQTNLLALNAAIEAARAGEHGKGFAVVADEVRKLAERSAGATKEIADLIGTVRAGVEDAVKAMESSAKEVAEGAAFSEEAGSALTQILESVQAVSDQVESMAAVAQEMTASVETVKESVQSVRTVTDENEGSVAEMNESAVAVSQAISSVAAITQEAAASAEELSASAEEVSASAQNASAAVEEQTASIEEMSASAEDLSRLALRLQELVSQFKVDESAAAPSLRVVDGAARKAA